MNDERKVSSDIHYRLGYVRACVQIHNFIWLCIFSFLHKDKSVIKSND